MTLAPRRVAAGGPAADAGVCLSMHQPWASLLVWGIKRIEGRGWPTEHRGRLWIAATAKQPTPQEIQELEGFYRTVHSEAMGGAAGADIEFPPAYPTGVLVGCVEVVDCLQAEQVEAWEGLPAGLKAEVGSPHCFLCQAAQRLVVPQPVRGWPKLFALEKKLHKAAQLGLRPAPNSRGFDWAAFGRPPSAHAPLPPSQSKHKYQELQRRMDAARAGGTGGDHEAGQQGRAQAAKTAACQSPRAAAAAPRAGDAHQQQEAQQAQQAQQQQDPQRRLRAVQKKLRQIAAIEEKRKAGQTLQAEELAKLAQRAQLDEEAAQLLALV